MLALLHPSKANFSVMTMNIVALTYLANLSSLTLLKNGLAIHGLKAGLRVIIGDSSTVVALEAF